MRNIIDECAVSAGIFTREQIERLGDVTLFFWRILCALPAAMKKFHLVVEQMMHLGVSSIPIISIASVFIGGVSAWQAQYLFADAIPLSVLGAAVGKAVFTEIGPVFTALIITGRISAKLAAELGTMRVTEQIDAMTCLSLDPYPYLLAPRMVAGVVMLPVLTVFSSTIAIVSAQLLAQAALGLNSAVFYQGLKWLFRLQDVIICLVKAFVFGGVITLSGCYFGYLTSGGAVGVGVATKNAVVAAMVLILLTNMIVVNILI
ncbi:MAG: ABC transporter permease [Chitinispirillaceae bacterium]|nr:ABC transporter permease [Chitinispirillaceae bacterium]